MSGTGDVADGAAGGGVADRAAGGGVADSAAGGGVADGAAGPRYGSTPTGVQYGPLVADDAMRCAELETVLFAVDGPWSAPTFLSEIGSRHNTCFAARLHGHLVGYAVLAALGHAGDREFEVHTIGVDPARQGLGIGRTLLRQMLDVADREHAPVVLDVRTDNVPARTLYEAHGFEIVGLRPRYYRPSNADAYLMVRPARSATAAASGAATVGSTGGAATDAAAGQTAGVRERRGEVGGS